MPFNKPYHFKVNNKVVVIKHKKGKYLRSKPGDLFKLDPDGGTGGFAQWTVELENGGTAARFKNNKNGKYLRIMGDDSINVNGGAGGLSLFKIHQQGAPGVVKLESNKYPGKYIAVGNNNIPRVGSGGQWTEMQFYRETPVAPAGFPNAQCRITIKNHFGKYVCAENANKQFEVNGNRDNAGPWEKFTSIPAGNGFVNFKTAHGKFLCAEKNDNSLVGNRDNAGPWEKFAVEKHGNKYAFKSAHGKYICNEDNKKGFKVVANRGKVGPWERFTVTVL